jgi:hypothetical protein
VSSLTTIAATLARLLTLVLPATTLSGALIPLRFIERGGRAWHVFLSRFGDAGDAVCVPDPSSPGD